MTQKTQKQLTRRDALKMLGAAVGAAALANLPSKWSTPELAKGVLPAHAQVSRCTEWALVIETIAAEGQVAYDYFTSSIDPTEMVQTPALVGTAVYWSCDVTGCLYVAFGLTGSGSVTVHRMRLCLRGLER